jgi:cysteine desulfurase
LGRTAEQAHSSLRVGIGRFNTEAEIDAAAAALIEVVARLREATPSLGT